MKIFSFLLVIFSLSVNAQLTFYPTYNLSNTSYATSDYHSVYSKFMLNSNFFVVWGDNGQIKFRRSTDFGATWSPNKTVSTTDNTCGWPVVVADEQGRVLVMYHTLGSGGTYQLITQRSIDSGENWSAMMVVPGSGNAITPQLAYDGYKVYAVWEDRIGTNYEIFFSTSEDFGSTWWITPMNLSNSPGSSRWVQLVSEGTQIYCAWIEGTTYPLSDIYFRKSTDGGYGWSTAVNLTNDGRPQNRFYLAAEGYNIYLACDDIPGAFNYDEIYLLKSSDLGSTWSAPSNITNNPGHSNTPCIFTAFGNLYFTWADNSHTVPAFDNMDIFFKWSTDDGVTWQDSINLSTNAESSSRPRFCRTLTGTIEDPVVSMTIAWYDYSLGAAEILARNIEHLIVPVELVSFNADVEGNSVHLNWLTATETNNKGFEVERRLYQDWETIAFVTGSGTTTEPKSYSYIDVNLQPGKYLYRLKQTDFDGTYEYSKEAEVEVTSAQEFSLTQNYPNPFNPLTKIRYAVPHNTHVKLSVYDLLGKEIAVLVNEEKSAGSFDITFDGSTLASGIYIYRLSADGFTSVRKLTVMK
jgi:hypothetical protein